jgi:hypothetical protein
MRRVAIAAVVVAVGTVGTAGIAGGAIKQKTASVELETEETGIATATCKKGTRAVSGGFDDPTFNAFAPPGSFASIFTSRRTSKRDWSSVFTNGFGVEPGTAFTYAYCSDDLPKLKVVSETLSIPNDAVESVTARCPRGGEAVSGGFAAEQVATYDGVFPYGSRRTGKRKWTATGYANPPAELTSFAYCAKHKLGLKVRSATTQTPDGANASVEASCRKRERVISGGFFAALDDGLFTDAFESRRTGPRRWTASTASFDNFDFTAYAYCLKKEKKA